MARLCDVYSAAWTRTTPSVGISAIGSLRTSLRAAGVACPNQDSTGAVLADVDGDGNLDLLVTSLGHGLRLFLNDGKGRFHEVTDQAGLRSNSGSTSLRACGRGRRRRSGFVRGQLSHRHHRGSALDHFFSGSNSAGQASGDARQQPVGDLAAMDESFRSRADRQGDRTRRTRWASFT